MDKPTPAERLLRAFESPAAADRFVARVRESPAHDLERIAGLIVATADDSPSPEAVIAAVAGLLGDERVPIMSEQAIAGAALMTAAECRLDTHAARSRREAIRERAAAGSLRNTTFWSRQFARDPDPDSYQALYAALTPLDVDDLITACAGDPNGQSQDARLAAGLLSRLVDKNDARFTDEARRRWAAVIGPFVAHRQRSHWKHNWLLNALAKIDPDAVEKALFDLVSAEGFTGPNQIYAGFMLSALTLARPDAPAMDFGRLIRQE